MLFVLDSDIIIDFLRNRNDAINKISSLRAKSAKICTTVLNYQEVMRGLIKKQHQEKEDIAEMFFSSLDIASYGINEAKIAARIEAHLEFAGQKISGFDIPIAAICLASNAAIVTRNTKHFQRVPGLKIETW